MDTNTVFIFDFDGVIVDSVAALYSAYTAFLDEFGIQGSQEEFTFLNGPKLAQIVLYLKQKHAIQKDTEELLDIYQAKISALYKNIKLNEGTEEILKLIKSKNYKIALASSSTRQGIESVLNSNKIDQYFDFVITGDDVENAKPSPEIYNAVRMKYPEHTYYVIEDSDNGIEAAIAAGMITLLFNPSQKASNGKARYSIHSLKQIRQIVAEEGMNCFTLAMAKNITLEAIEHEPSLDECQAREVDELWSDMSEKKHLFNGDIVSYRSHQYLGEELKIECFITQYKYFLAQMTKPQLDLSIAPIGVAGIIIDTDHYSIIGERRNTTEYEGFNEFIPAGSIDPSRIEDGFILFQEQIIEEFEEETQLSRCIIDQIEPCGMIFDQNHGVYDIYFKILIKGRLSQLLKSKQNAEYRNIQIMELDKIEHKMLTSKFVPTSNVIYNNVMQQIRMIAGY